MPPGCIFFHSSTMLFTEGGITDKNKNSPVLLKSLYQAFLEKRKEGSLSDFPSSLWNSIHTETVSRPFPVSCSLLPCTDKTLRWNYNPLNFEEEKVSKVFKMLVLETRHTVQMHSIHTPHYPLKKIVMVISVNVSQSFSMDFLSLRLQNSFRNNRKIQSLTVTTITILLLK